VTLHDAVDAIDIDYPGFYPHGILIARALRKRQEIEAGMKDAGLSAK